MVLKKLFNTDVLASDDKGEVRVEEENSVDDVRCENSALGVEGDLLFHGNAFRPEHSGWHTQVLQQGYNCH